MKILLNDINNNYDDLKSQINCLKEEIKILKKEINNIKLLNKTNIKNISFLKDLAKDAYAYSDLDNTFNIFKSIDDILFLIYTNDNKSITSYNLINNQKLNEIKNAHDNDICNFRHYLDNIRKRDLILSISKNDNNLKLWDINNFNCLLDIKNLNGGGELLSSCFLNINYNIYIISSSSNYDLSEPIKIFNLAGKKIKEINNSKEDTLFIDVFYDKLLAKYFIITGNIGFVKSYDYNENKLYCKYNAKDNCSHCSIIIVKDIKITKLIESSRDGNIRIWDFHSNKLLNKIYIAGSWLIGICLWNNENLFVSSTNLILVNLKDKKIKHFYNKEIISLKKIFHPIYKECLISHGVYPNDINLWVNNNID